MTDFQVRYDEQKGYYDIVFDEQGNLVLENSLDNAINMSLFCDARADISEVQVPELRRGWWGNELNENNRIIGSKLWLLKQRRATFNTLNSARDYCKNALQHLVDENYVKSIEVTTSYSDNNSKILAKIKFVGIDSIVDIKTYNLFLNTIP